MAEISKQFKIMLVINIVIFLAYAILYMFMINLWAPIIEYTYSTPWYAQIFGLVLFVIAVWLLRAILQKKNWEDISFLMEFIYTVMFGMIIYLVLEMWFVIDKLATPIAWLNAIISVSITGALFVVNMIFYFIETARHK